MKKIVLFLLFITTILSCEKDDICIDATTPKLIIRFYDNTNKTVLKSVPSLYVWATDKDSIKENVSVDSLVIPLNTIQDISNYNFSSNSIIDEVTISYTRSDEFVSRSCGYKTIFDNLSITTTSNWILDSEIINSTVNNETSAHLYIYH